MNHETSPPSIHDDGAFDLRARAEMALAFEPGAPPAHLLRKPPRWIARRGVQRLVAGLLLASTGVGTVLAMRPPELVRGAIEHEYYERTLRGSFMDPRQLLARIGLGDAKVMPGFPQLMRPCEIEGQLVYHLTTFIEKGGMVTVFAFDQPVNLKDGSGWWNNVYWQVLRSRDGKPLVLVAQRRRALTVAQAQLQSTPQSTPVPTAPERAFAPTPLETTR